MNSSRLAILFLLLLTVGCAGLSSPGGTPPPEVYVTPSPATPAAEAATATPSGPISLRIWLPPEFDPSAGTTAGEILQRRLDEFASRRPGTHIEVRIKEPDGPGGLLDSLTTANAAAPLALPDLVALPRSALETAALKGLVHPFTGLSDQIDTPEWFEYAQQLARLQNSTFGIPFAGDAMILVYRPSVLSLLPEDLTSALRLEGPLAFPAADPQALFTLALYQAAGGGIRDEQGRPILQADILEQVLELYQDGSEAEYTPFWLTQLQTDEQAWGEFTEKNAPLVVTWISRYLSTDQADMAAAPLLTLAGNDFTISNGWVWALGSPDPERQELATELAEFLSEADFLSEWTSETGYLPPRASSLENWRDAGLQPLALRVAQSAQLMPAGDLLASLAPVLQGATIDVLKKQTDPQSAARNAADSLAVP